MAEAIIGQQTVIERLMIALLANGNVLIEGLPGTAKTPLTSILNEVDQREFREQLDLTSRHLFAFDGEATNWDGRELWTAFRHLSRGLRHRSERIRTSSLPALNPPAASN